MNITFWNSPMPNSANVKGMTAATGMLRPTITSGPKKALIRRKQPQTTPSGTPTTAARPNPSTTRLRLTSVLRVSSRSNQRLGKAAKVVAGLGKIVWADDGRAGSRRRRSAHHHSRQTDDDAEDAHRHALPGGDFRPQGMESAAPTRAGAAGGELTLVGWRRRLRFALYRVCHRDLSRSGILVGWDQRACECRPTRFVSIFVHGGPARKLTMGTWCPVPPYGRGLLFFGRVDLDLHAAILAPGRRGFASRPAGPSPGRRHRTGWHRCSDTWRPAHR